MKTKLVFLTLLAITSITAHAYSFKVDGIYYRFSSDNGTVAVTYSSTELVDDGGYNEQWEWYLDGNEDCYYYKPSYNSFSIIIPSSVIYNNQTYQVTSIDSHAFENSYLYTVSIPNSITAIGEYAFYNCSSLYNVKVYSTTPISIYSSSFPNRANITLRVPPGCNAAYTAASYWQNFKAIYESTVIVFADANVKSLCVANWDKDGDRELSTDEAAEVKSLGTVFKENSSITSFNELQYFTGLTEINKSAFLNTYALNSIIIPQNVTSLGKHSFAGMGQYCSEYYTTIQLPNGLKTIDEYAFWRSNLREIEFPNSLRDIGTYAFCSTKLQSLTLPEGVKTIGTWAFSSDYLETIAIPSTVTSIGEGAFSSCNHLRSIVVSESNTIYDSRNNCNALIETATDKLLFGCKQTIIPDGIKAIGNHAFSNSKTTINIPNSVIAIGNYAFESCENLRQIDIPNGVTTIGDGAFSYCRNLCQINIPSSVTTIGNGAFSECGNYLLVNVDIETPLSITAGTFDSNSLDISTLYVPYGCKSAYQSAPYWQSFGTIEEVVVNASGITLNQSTLSFNAANQTATLTATVTPENATNKSVTWTSSNTAVAMVDENGVVTAAADGTATITATTADGTNLSASCEVTVAIPVIITFSDLAVKAICVANWDTSGDGELSMAEAAAVTSLGEVFKNNRNITTFDELQYFTGLTTIGSSAFYYCTGLTSIIIPSSITSIGEEAFLGCSGLTSITIPNSVTSIGNSAFKYCRGLTSITIPNSMTSIGGYAFYECSCLSKAEFASIESMCRISFGNTYAHPLCNSSTNQLYICGEEITDLVIPSNLIEIGKWAFYNCRGLTSVTIPKNIAAIGEAAFRECKGLRKTEFADIESLCTISFEDYDSNPLYYADHLFIDGNEITNVIIPGSVTSIGKYAFFGFDELLSLTISEGVTKIGYRAFNYCRKLKTVSIPNSMTSIGDIVFRDCASLRIVKVGMTTPFSITEDVFSNRANATLYVPAGSRDAYEAANYWTDFKEIIEFIEGDVNGDGEMDVVDVVDIARYVVGTPAETFVPILADINNNGDVNIADAVCLVNEIAGDQNFVKAMRAPRRIEEGEETLMLNGDNNGLSLALENQRSYTAFQFDLYVPETTDVTSMLLNTQRKQKHQLLYNKVEDGHWRVAAISTSNRSFDGNDGELLAIVLDGIASDDISIRNIHFFTADGGDYMFDDIMMQSGIVTDIKSPLPTSPREGEQSVFDLQGRKITNRQLPKGVYIVNGKKVSVK